MSQELCSSMEKAPQRALLKALGLTDSEIQKPIIAVITAKSEVVPGNAHLDRIADAVKAGVYAGGCTPIVIPCISVCDGLAMSHGGGRYALPARELVADSVETVLKAHAFEGAVFIPDSDKAVAGMLMGAARVNIPSVFVTGGPVETGEFRGKKAGFSAMYEKVGAVKNGDMNRAQLDDMESFACPGAVTALTLNCLPESLGMALPGDGTALADSSERIRIAKRAGLAVCDLVRDAVTPRMIMTKHTFGNAVTLDMALGGSTNTILHILAIADECKIAITLDAIEQIAEKTPVLHLPFPASDFGAEDFHRSGGVYAVMHELAKKNLIDGSVFTVHGCALATDYEHAHVKDEGAIRKIDKPISDKGGVTVLRGSLAEDGALVKRSGLTKSMTTFSGKARCFNCEEDAMAAINAGRIKSGEVIVVRYEGPVGGPGMREMLAVPAALAGMGMHDQIAFVTDGRISDDVKCLCVGHVCPEAAAGGKLALVADGDVIKIDVPSGRINLDVPAKTLDARRKKLRPKDSNASGSLLRYQNLVTSADLGAVLKKKF